VLGETRLFAEGSLRIPLLSSAEENGDHDRTCPRITRAHSALEMTVVSTTTS
jgi:hypothetical protein